MHLIHKGVLPNGVRFLGNHIVKLDLKHACISRKYFKLYLMYFALFINAIKALINNYILVQIFVTSADLISLNYVLEVLHKIVLQDTGNFKF